MEDTTPSGRPIIDRGKTAPFLIRTFIKIGSFHRVAQFEDGPIPTADEHQIFTWKDATLREVLTTLRATAPALPEMRHPLARYSFRTLYADSATRGRLNQKDLGIVYSRDILGEPGSLAAPAPRLLTDEDVPPGDDERSLDELRFVPGDYLCVAVLLPKNATIPGPGGELAIKGSATPVSAPAANGWKSGARTDGGWGGGASVAAGPPGGLGRGGGHWRGGSDAPPAGPRGGRGGRGGFGGRDRDDDRRVPPPRRDSPPPPRRDTRGDRRDRRGGSRSRSPPRRRLRYD
ncbi:Sin3 associated polypeptide p18-domain-containing protein [Fomitopsis serialis]|uniref:Sin3 associated polypeptide p18-domain-containing protein n=1 Tax=Fomitopsis serialis TaxID=139415 RepID=UPI0020084964|nr:Sin3 associated polypeptide p18-domain-containing protein [Neoantrodia serialis]KAH9927334.1 Sin3 associated polypeptide p18-domain-containing protein [Neoantrodia serialis]